MTRRARARRPIPNISLKQLIADVFGSFRRRRACARRAHCARKLGSQLFLTRLKKQFPIVADLTDLPTIQNPKSTHFRTGTQITIWAIPYENQTNRPIGNRPL